MHVWERRDWIERRMSLQARRQAVIGNVGSTEREPRMEDAGLSPVIVPARSENQSCTEEGRDR